MDRIENTGGGKEWAGLIFLHPYISKNQLAKHLVKLVNLNFSLIYFNHESSDTGKGLCNHKDKKE